MQAAPASAGCQAPPSAGCKAPPAGLYPPDSEGACDDRDDPDRQGRPRLRIAPHPGQSPRPGRRRDGHRQDRHPADPGRGLLPRRRPGLLRRHQGRPLRHRHGRQAQPEAGPAGARPGRGGFRLRAQPGGLLGRLRPAGPPAAGDRRRDGPAAARPHAGAERHPGRRAHHRLQAGRRRGPAAARLQGPARHPDPCRGPRQRTRRRLRQRQQGHHRHHPAPAADAGAGRRRGILRRARPGAGRPHAAHPRWPRRGERAGRRQADRLARGSMPPSCSGCCPSCSRNCRRSATSTSPSWSSSSTRPTCCSATRRAR